MNLGNFKIGHCAVQDRPLRGKTGQYPRAIGGMSELRRPAGGLGRKQGKPGGKLYLEPKFPRQPE
jgi:hypothetical protein